MAYEKTRKYEKALKDAEMSTQLKPDWVKVCMYACIKLSAYTIDGKLLWAYFFDRNQDGMATVVS